MTAVYRLRQGARALLAFSHPVDLELAREHLSPALFALFERLQRSEQAHSLNVLRSVLAQGDTPPELAAAALLHDCGKVRWRLRIWQKTLAVLVRKGAPALFQRWSRGDARNFWVRPFVVSEQHAAWSGELLAAAGAPEAVVWLGTHHADPLEGWYDHPYAELLGRLQAADNAN